LDCLGRGKAVVVVAEFVKIGQERCIGFARIGPSLPRAVISPVAIRSTATAAAWSIDRQRLTEGYGDGDIPLGH
jgi:hypothetical protein